jgi:hypothetical protein
LRERACFGGPICSRADPLFKAKTSDPRASGQTEVPGSNPTRLKIWMNSVENTILAKLFQNTEQVLDCYILHNTHLAPSHAISNFYRLMVAFTEDLEMEVWKGYVYASLFFITTMTQSFFFHQVFHISICAGTRIKASVIAAIYKKVWHHSGPSFCVYQPLKWLSLIH